MNLRLKNSGLKPIPPRVIVPRQRFGNVCQCLELRFAALHKNMDELYRIIGELLGAYGAGTEGGNEVESNRSAVFYASVSPYINLSKLLYIYSDIGDYIEF